MTASSCSCSEHMLSSLDLAVTTLSREASDRRIDSARRNELPRIAQCSQTFFKKVIRIIEIQSCSPGKKPSVRFHLIHPDRG